MRIHSILLIAGVAVSTPAAADYLFASVPGESFEINGSASLEARFKADTTNWDLRLATEGTPVPGGNQANLANGHPNFEGRGFDFSLTYDAGIDTFTWNVEAQRGKAQSLTYTNAGITHSNAFQIFTSGSRASVTVTDLVFEGVGEFIDVFPDISTSPSGPTFAQTYLVLQGANLAAENWSLAGSLVFDNFTTRNPGEGAKINIKLVDAAIIPAPGVGLALMIPLAMRRRRSFSND